MSEPIFAMIIPLGGGMGAVDPGFGNRPIHHPGHPEHGLPSQPGHPSQPIYHPGHPDHGLPPGSSSGGSPSQPIYNPAQPDQGLPPGGTDIPSNELPMPEPPPDHSDDIIVAVHKPGEEWVVKAYENVQPGNELPSQPGRPSQPIASTPSPKGRRG